MSNEWTMGVQRRGRPHENLLRLLRQLEGVVNASMHLLEGADEMSVVIFDKAPRMRVLAEGEGLRISIEQLDDNCWVERLVTWREVVGEVEDLLDDEGYEDRAAQLGVLDTLEREIGLLREKLGKD
jgi:hypothetical protein